MLKYLELSSILLNNLWIKENITRRIRKYFALTINENKTYQILWDAGKAVLTGQFTTLNVYIRNDKRSKINYLNSHLKKTEKEKQHKSNINRRKL